MWMNGTCNQKSSIVRNIQDMKLPLRSSSTYRPLQAFGAPGGPAPFFSRLQFREEGKRAQLKNTLIFTVR